MTDREDKYIDSLQDNFADLLDKFMGSDAINRENKESILNDMKFMIDERIRALKNEDSLS